MQKSQAMRPKDTDIPIEELRKRLRYDPETGHLIWLDGPCKGRIAGFPHRGYWRVLIFRRQILAHRIVWALEHGAWPEDRLDHRNGDGSANRLANLRPATMPEQQQNKALYKNSRSGFTGVTFHKASGRWLAHIAVGKKRRWIGYFDTPEAAHYAYLKAKQELHPFQPKPR